MSILGPLLKDEDMYFLDMPLFVFYALNFYFAYQVMLWNLCYRNLQVGWGLDGNGHWARVLAYMTGMCLRVYVCFFPSDAFILSNDVIRPTVPTSWPSRKSWTARGSSSP